MKPCRCAMVTRAILGCLLIFFLAGADYGIAAGKATLMLSPNTGTYRIGDSFNVDIFVNTGGQNVVAVAAYVKYDPAYFRANSIDTTGSVFGIEAEKKIDSTHGLIKITRGEPTPGRNAPDGRIASVNLTALSHVNPRTNNVTFVIMTGSTSVSAVILDDGLGTDILGTVVNAKFAIAPDLTISLQSPSNPSVCNSSTLVNNYQPSFNWTATGTFTKYTILFSTSPSDFTTQGTLITKGNVPGSKNSWRPPLMVWKKLMTTSNNKGVIRDICWKVTGTTSDRWPVESEVWRVRVGDPQQVTINSPANGVVLSPTVPPTFDWQTNGNVKFRLEISSLPDFSNPTKTKSLTYTTRDPNVETSLKKPLPLFHWNAVKKMVGQGTGYFRIKAWDGINRETVLETRSFTIQ